MDPRSDQLDDYRWLVGPEGAGWIGRAAERSGSGAAHLDRLRRDLPAGRARLVLEQAELRERAKAKFAAPERMFFTRVGLEQATDQYVAHYKAARFPAGQPAADLCCGLGADLLALASRGPAVGVDRDPVAALLAEANLRVLGLPSAAMTATEVRLGDAADFPVGDFSAWHIDPDRRPQGRRTTQVILHEPGPDVIQRLLTRRPDAAVKLAPAATLPQDWPARAELEWISRDRQCRQLVAWFGAMARAPGRRRATLVGSHPSAGPGPLWTLEGEPAAWPALADQVGRYVFEPDPSVIAADLVGTLAARHGLSGIARGIAYLTGDRPTSDAGLSCFEVHDVLPLDLKRLKRLLHARNIGRLEIKKRGVPHDPEMLRRRLALTGDSSAVLLLAPFARGHIAILARRA